MYEKFAALLADRGISAYTVAKATGISNSTFYEWKQGKYQPKIDKIAKIAKYFGKDVTYFLEAS